MQGANLTWEIRTVNHRYLDAHFKLPESVRFLEVALKEKASNMIKRGRLDANLVLDTSAALQEGGALNVPMVQNLHKMAEQVQQLTDCAPLSVADVLAWPGVITAAALDIEELEAAVLDSLDLALDDLVSSRQSEGKRLAKMLSERVSSMQLIISQLREEIPNYEQQHQDKWQDRLDKLHEQEIDAVRLNQEIALLISKADVSEELDRLESHLEEFATILQSAEPVGRRLDFLLQEFHREANTLGSKSIHQDITAASVDLKVLIDQLKEQVQNVE